MAIHLEQSIRDLLANGASPIDVIRDSDSPELACSMVFDMTHIHPDSTQGEIILAKALPKDLTRYCVKVIVNELGFELTGQALDISPESLKAYAHGDIEPKPDEDGDLFIGQDIIDPHLVDRLYAQVRAWQYEFDESDDEDFAKLIRQRTANTKARAKKIR